MSPWRPCPLCESGDCRPLHQVPRGKGQPHHWTLVECTACGMVYIQEKLDYQTQGEQFDWRETYRAESARRDLERPMARRVSRVVGLVGRLVGGERGAKTIQIALRHKTSGRWCDFGCGKGGLLARVPKSFSLHGVDLSASQAEMARQRVPEAEIVIAPVTEAPLADASFDVISMQSYLEHEQTPLAALASAYRALVPGGVIVLKTPNYACWNRRLRGWKWSGFRFPDHCNHFTYPRLAVMVRRAAFEPLPGSFLDRLPTSDNMYLAAKKGHGT